MAKMVISATVVKLATVDYSAQVKGATLTIDAPEVDISNMGSAGWNEVVGGVKKGSLAVEFVKDADLSGLDAAMFAALGTVITFEISKTSDAAGATNPHYTGSLLVTQWTPIAGAVGAAFGGSYTWTTTGAITRDITP